MLLLQTVVTVLGRPETLGVIYILLGVTMFFRAH